MDSITAANSDRRLLWAVVAPQWRSHHEAIVESGMERTWRALHELRWVDLPVGRLMIAARGIGFGGRIDRPWIDTFAPVAAIEEDAPRRSTMAMVGRPWSLIPRSVPVRSLREVRSFSARGWLRYGMEWRLTPLADGRTLVETETICCATDVTAARRFRAYWWLISLGSGWIRQEMLHAIERIASAPEARGPYDGMRRPTRPAGRSEARPA